MFSRRTPPDSGTVDESLALGENAEEKGAGWVIFRLLGVGVMCILDLFISFSFSHSLLVLILCLFTYLSLSLSFSVSLYSRFLCLFVVAFNDEFSSILCGWQMVCRYTAYDHAMIVVSIKRHQSV